MKYMRIDKFPRYPGYSKDAIRFKTKRGQWLEGREWKKVPGGRSLISIENRQLRLQ